MSDERDGLDGRLRTALTTDVTTDVRRRHLSAMQAAVEGRRRTKRAVTALVAACLLVPGVAVAAEGSAPGDTLYPVKRWAEPVRTLVHPEVRLVHRVEEVEILVARRAPSERLQRALSDAARELEGRRGNDRIRTRIDLQRLQRRLEAAAAAAGLLDDTDPGEHNRPTPQLTDPEPTTTPARPAERSPTTPPAPTADQAPAADAEPREFTIDDVGNITVMVSADGVRLRHVTAERSWTWRSDTRGEPREILVAFVQADRTIRATIRFDGRDAVLILDRR